MTHVNLTVQTPDWEKRTPEERRAWTLALDRAVTNLGQITAWAVEGVPGDEESPQFDWVGWEAEPEMTGDGSGDPEKHFLTIRDPAGEELALIVHRTVGGKFPLDGEVANEKITSADMIVAALNDHDASAEAPGLCYSLELGVDISDARVHALTISPFPSQESAEQFAKIARGFSVYDVASLARKVGVVVDAGEAGGTHATVTGAALVKYVHDGETLNETDLY